MTIEQLEEIGKYLTNRDYYLEAFVEQYNGWLCGHCRMPFKTNFVVQRLNYLSQQRYNFYFRCDRCTQKIIEIFEDCVIILTEQDIFTLRALFDLPIKERK